MAAARDIVFRDPALENVLQRKLQLPHAHGSRTDTAETRASQTGVRKSPNRVIEQVVRLPAELHLVPFFRHAEVLLQVGIEDETGRTDNRIPPCGAQLVQRL